MIQLVPLTQRTARQWVNRVHRHLDYPVGDVCRVGLESDGELVAVAVAGRPGARKFDDGKTLEVTRLASAAASELNACSRLYGAIRRAAAALGYRRLLTYTRDDEPGTSPSAANFEDCGLTTGGEWTRKKRKRKAAENSKPKRRWILKIK